MAFRGSGRKSKEPTQATMHRYRSHTCGALSRKRYRQRGAAFRLVSSHPRPWRRAVHRSARPLRHYPMVVDPTSPPSGGRNAALGMGGDASTARCAGAHGGNEQSANCRPARSKSHREIEVLGGPPNCRCRSSATRNIRRRSRLKYRFLDLRREHLHRTSCCAAQ